MGVGALTVVLSRVCIAALAMSGERLARHALGASGGTPGTIRSSPSCPFRGRWASRQVTALRPVALTTTILRRHSWGAPLNRCRCGPESPLKRQTPSPVWVVINSILILLAMTTYFEAIAFGLTPTEAVALIYLFPMWTLVLGLATKTKVPLRYGFPSVLLGVAGALLTTGVWEQRSGVAWGLGAAVALLNGVIFALIVQLSRRMSTTSGDARGYTARSFVSATLIALAGVSLLELSGAAAGATDLGTGPAWRVVLLCGGMGVLGTAMPYLLLFRGTHRVSATSASVLLLSEPAFVVCISQASGVGRTGNLQLLGVAVIIVSAMIAQVGEVRTGLSGSAA